MAAQNRISRLQASGRKSDYAKEKAAPLENIPWGAEEGNSYTKDTLYYVTSDDKLDERSAAYYILPQDQVERELWEQSWVIAEEDCIVAAGAVIPAEQEGDFVYLPLTVLGKQTGQIRGTVTLRDLRTDGVYVLTVPYTLREEDTQVTATFTVGENSITRKVPFGSSLNDLAEEGKAFDLTEAERESLGGKPEGFERWENTDITLVADTEFRPVYKTEQPDPPDTPTP